MDILKIILEKLPSAIQYDGLEFEFKIINNGGSELRLVYTLVDSMHLCWNNPFINGKEYRCSFLYLKEGIESIEDLQEAVEECREFLLKNKLIKK